jgi:hypothetical protein
MEEDEALRLRLDPKYHLALEVLNALEPDPDLDAYLAYLRSLSGSA